MHDEPNVIKTIKTGCQRGAEYVMRIDDTREHKRLLEDQPGGTSRSRPTLRWSDVVGQDKELGVISWRKKSRNKSNLQKFLGPGLGPIRGCNA